MKIKLLISLIAITGLACLAAPTNRQSIFLGTSANDHTGDPARTAGQKINDNFLELYSFAQTNASSGGTATNAIIYTYLNDTNRVGVVVTNIIDATHVNVITGTNALALRNTNNVVIRQLITDAYINIAFSTNSSGEITATQTVNTNLVLVNGGSNYVFSGSVSGNFTASNNLTVLGTSTFSGFNIAVSPTNNLKVFHGTNLDGFAATVISNGVVGSGESLVLKSGTGAELNITGNDMNWNQDATILGHLTVSSLHSLDSQSFFVMNPETESLVTMAAYRNSAYGIASINNTNYPPGSLVYRPAYGDDGDGNIFYGTDFWINTNGVVSGNGSGLTNLHGTFIGIFNSTNSAFSADSAGNVVTRKLTAHESITAQPTNSSYPIQIIPKLTGNSMAIVGRDNSNTRDAFTVSTNGDFTGNSFTGDGSGLSGVIASALSSSGKILFNNGGAGWFFTSNLNGDGSGLTNTTVTSIQTTTNYTYTFFGRAGDHVIITNKPNLFLTLAGPFDGDVAFAIEATNNIYIDYGGNSVEWLTPSNNPTASQGHGTLGISKFGSLVKVAFVEGAASTTNFLSAIQTYSTNVTLVSATSLVVQFSPGFADVNYVVTAPNDLVGATVTSRTPTNFTLGFTAVTLTSQVIEGGVIHR